MHVTIPDKLYFKIGEVGKLAQVPTHVLRYWETEFKNIKPKRANTQRLYRREDVELILRIKTLLHEQGYTIAGARKLLESGGDSGQLATAGPSAEIDSAATGKQVVKALGDIKNELLKIQKLIAKRR